MAKQKTVRDIPLEDLTIGKAQVRLKDVQKEVDELAESIKVQGLLQPIVVCEGEKGKFEILTGQRRYLAHKQLKLKTIQAIVLETVDEHTAKAISLSENLIRRDISQKEKIDACTALFKKYGSIKLTAEETGISANLVSMYVKYDRLIKPLRDMIDKGEIDIKVALRAQDAAAAGSEKIPEKEAVKLAKEMKTMPGVQQDKLVKQRQEDPDTSVDDAIEEAKTGSKVTQVVVTLSSEVHKQLQAYAKAEEITQDDAARSLIEEALAGKGFG